MAILLCMPSSLVLLLVTSAGDVTSVSCFLQSLNYEDRHGIISVRSAGDGKWRSGVRHAHSPRTIGRSNTTGVQQENDHDCACYRSFYKPHIH